MTTDTPALPREVEHLRPSEGSRPASDTDDMLWEELLQDPDSASTGSSNTEEEEPHSHSHSLPLPNITLSSDEEEEALPQVGCMRIWWLFITLEGCWLFKLWFERHHCLNRGIWKQPRDLKPCARAVNSVCQWWYTNIQLSCIILTDTHHFSFPPASVLVAASVSSF